MINTITVKDQQVANGFYSDGSGPEVILIEGSCRIVPYLNYFRYLNSDNRFTINAINIVLFHFDANNNRVDVNCATEKFESNPRMLNMLKSVKYFVHEPCMNFGMFNTIPMSKKSIYDFGINPRFDIIIPSFEAYVLFQDFVNFDTEIQQQARRDWANVGCLSFPLRAKIKSLGLSRLEDFYKACSLSSFPEFGGIFSNTWRNVRLFHTNNHVSNQYTIQLFRLMNEQYFKLNITQEFWLRINAEDMYFEGRTLLTDYDVENYGITWNEPAVHLKV